MIIEGLITFLALSVIFVIVGKSSDNIVMEISGFFIIILLSFTFFSGQIEFKSGEDTITQYTYDNASRINQTSESMTIQYEDFTSIDKVIYGLLLLFSGLIGVFGVWRNYRADWGGYEDE